MSGPRPSRTLAQEDPATLAQIASDPESSPARLEELYELVFPCDEDHPLGALLAENPNTPVRVLRWLAPEYPAPFFRNAALPLLLLEDPRFFDSVVSESLCASPEAPALYLYSAARAKYPDLRYQIAAHPNCPQDLLLSFLRGPEERLQRRAARRLLSEAPIPWRALWRCRSQDVRLMVLQRGCPEEVLWRFIKDERPLVRAAIAAQPRTPVALLEVLSRDVSALVRQAIAENTMTPPATRGRLARDPERCVNRAAKAFPASLQGSGVALRGLARAGFQPEATLAHQKQQDAAAPIPSRRDYQYRDDWDYYPQTDPEDYVLDPRDIDAHCLHRKRAPKTDPAKRKRPP